MKVEILSWVLVLSLLGGHVMEAKTKIKQQPFGKTPEGIAVDLYTLTNRRGMEVAITNYGGIVVQLRAPDRKGNLADVVLGYDDLDGYLHDKAYLGALIGRYGNRIAQGSFSLGGKTYTLPRNNGENTLHGGLKGFNQALWRASEVKSKNGPALQLEYLSKDGEEGFPGNLSVKVLYTLTDKNELQIEYSATTDKETVINLTSHSYFNLAGAGNADILQHQVMLRAEKFTPVSESLIPTGELRSVQNTPMDFRTPMAVGARIDQDDQQLKYGRGYDHNWVLDSGGSKTPTLAATVYEPGTGRELEVWTTEPGVQFYTGNFLDGVKGKGGKAYLRRYALCLETQHFPDSPNHPNFPSTVLKPGEQYHTVTIYKFSAR
ncbi:MAG TPA: aldose epimerase family protein [Terriglobales bacterium]|nr:aldose epimerase family protein [Terriglobales bacterium]